MKILMFGRGVISTQYGWAFEKAGHSVEFYVRPGRAAKYGPTLPLQILDARKKMKGILIDADWKVNIREDIPANHDYDLIIVSVQHYQFAEAASFLGPKVGKATVLIFNNFWKDPLQEARALPLQQLAWGFPQAGGGFSNTGLLKGALFPDVHFGTFGTEPASRELAVRALFKESGFTIIEHSDFRGWLYIHFAINAGLFSKVLQVGSVDQVIRSGRHIKNAILNVRESLQVVAARGIDLAHHAADTRLYRRPAWLGALMIRALLKISPPFRLTISSHANPEEVRSYCRDVLAEAHLLTCKVPGLEAVAEHL